MMSKIEWGLLLVLLCLLLLALADTLQRMLP